MDVKYLLIILLCIVAIFITLRKCKEGFVVENITEIVSPAHGKIQAIEKTMVETNNGPVEYIHIITFLSVFDNHTQTYPCDGVITDQQYDRSGKFHLAFQLDKSDLNEKVITEITPSGNRLSLATGGLPIIVQRIAGLVARRITILHDVGTKVKKLNKQGEILFGSRVDTIIPAKGAMINVAVGDKVVGAKTVLASYK